MITAEPFRATVYAKIHLVEQVMALHGRGSPNPKRYRELLEGMDLPALRRAIDEPPDFPAPDCLTSNAGAIAHRVDTGESPAEARDILEAPSTNESQRPTQPRRIASVLP